LVSYDIPDSKKKERDWFAKTLKDLGFERIQESLWVYPFECDQEIAVIAQNLGISPHVATMMAKKIPREEKMKEEFNL
jgi:CRISPR-associated endonuclease Cas2